MRNEPIINRIKLLIVTLAIVVARASAQDPVIADPQHFKIEFEDSRMRVLRLTLPSGEYTPMIDLSDRTETVLHGSHLLFYAESERLARGSGLADEQATPGTVSHFVANYGSIKNIGAGIYESIITELKPLTFAHAGVEAVSPIAQSPGELWGEKKAGPQETGKPAVQPSGPRQLKPEVAAEPSISKRIQTGPANPQATDAVAKGTVPEPTSLNVDGAKVLFVNEAELAYIERGQGSAVVLVHDTLGDYRSWAPQLTAAARNHRVIAYSRRYHYPNHSNGKERDYTYELNAKDLAEFIRGLNAGPVSLVGFGYGASIAGLVAAEHPELVKALAITEPAYELLLDPTSAFRSRFAREDIYGIIRKPLTKDKPEKGIQMYVDWLGYQSWAALSQEEQYRKKQNANALHAQTLDAAPPNFTCATGKRIVAPTLILSGQRRSPNSAEIAGVLSACIANAERATVANAGGAVYVDNPAEANRLLIEFLNKH